MTQPNRLNDEQILAIASQHGTPVLALDCDVLRSQFRDLQQALPRVEFYYAVKAFPHAAIVKTLDESGACFDIASTGETELLRSLYINPRKSIHTHPIKKDRDIRDAMRFGCTTFVVDNLDEVKKFRKYRNRVALLLRVSFRSADAIVDLSRKFGCSPDEVPQLLQRAEDMGIRVKGLSFHVGSQSQKPDAHVGAIRRCGALIKEWDKYSSIPMSILDIGGGFPVDYKLDGTTIVDIQAYCAPIRDALKDVPEDIHIIAEPGRFLVAPAATAIAQVVGKAARGGQTWYYLDDGVYNSYSGRIYDHAQYPIRVLNEKQGPTTACVLAGPTCDSIDVIEESIELPDLEIGDLIIGEVMGAYTAATATEFNSLAKSKIIVLNEKKSGVVSHVA